MTRRPHAPLWLWMGLRMSALAISAVILVAVGMWAYFQRHDQIVLRDIPDAARAEILALREHPHENQERLWEFIHQYYPIEYFLPGLTNPDWWMVAVMLTITLPFLVLAGLLVSRPLSRQFTQVTQAAHRVAEGDFAARAQVEAKAPQELSGLAIDFNDMTARLQQYEREVRESSAMLAHELRTPLNAAMGRVQGMLDEVFPNEPAQLHLVLRQLEQINRLVGDLHLLSLARAGQLHLESESFALRDLVEEHLAWFAPALREAGVAANTKLPATLRIDADRDRLGQVLSILIDNALRHAAAGGELSIAAEADRGGVTLHVADRGPGVTPEELPRLLDRFWRADGSRARHSGGSGLGLAIAAAICESHGGSLAFRNRDGGGLEAVLHLPQAATGAAQWV